MSKSYDYLQFLYDGWNLLAEVDRSGNLVRSYAWSLDLSGGEEGAGGVGGLISVTLHDGDNAGTYSYAYDGNGNVVAVVNAADGQIVGQYVYGPFGEGIRCSGAVAKENPFRFSTKYQDDETDLLYYGQRYYIPSTGRWLSRDPIGELGGANLYGFVDNDPLHVIDPMGLYQEGGHYYTTFIAAVIAGRRDIALPLAFYSQLPDELESLTAYASFGETVPKATGNAISFGNIDPRFDSLQRLLHSLAGGDAQPRRDCLQKLLQDSSLQLWERGLLIHAFGDSYAHSYRDERRYISFIGLGERSPPITNPNYGQEFLYGAPIGHALTPLGGQAPDFVSQRPDLYGQYLTDLTTTLSGGSLNAAQTARVKSVLNEVNGFSKTTIGDLEIARFRGIAIQFGYPQSGYRPEASPNKAHSPVDFLAGPGKELGLSIPSESQVDALLDKIRRTCCER